MDNKNNSLDGNLQQPDSNLYDQNVGPVTGSGFGHRRISPFGFDRLAFAITAVAVLVVLSISAITYFLVNSSHKKPTDTTPKADKYSVSSLPTGTVQSGSQLQVGGVDKLAVNGQLRVSKGLVIAPTSAPSTPTAGQFYFDKNTKAAYYFDGTQFVSIKPEKSQSTSIQGITGSVNVGGGISMVNSTLVNSGVISIQGQTGAVSFAGGNGIAINGSTITNTGILGIGGNPSQLSITSTADGNVQLQIVGIQDGGVLVGTTGNGIDTVKPTMGGQCLISDPSTQKPVFGSCSGAAAVTGITVGSTTLTNNVLLQGAGGIAVTQSGQTITIDGSSIVPGVGDVKFGATHTAGHITMLDTNGDLVNSDISQLSGGLQVQQANYFVDLANSGTSTLTVKNSSGSNVANLTVTGVVQANGGIKDSNGNLYAFATTPTGSSREICYVDNLNASNCPTGGNVSRSGTATNNRLTKFDASGNIQNSALTETGTSLQVSAASYSIDLQNSGSNSTLSILNSDGTRVANLSVEGSISTSTGFLQGTDLYTLPTNGGNGGVLCYVKSGVSNCPTGGNVSYGTTQTGYVTYVDGSGTLSTTDLAFTSGKLQAAVSGYTLDFVNNSGASTLNVTNSGSGGVANLAVSGSVTATGGLIAHTLTDNTANGVGNDLRISSTNNNIVFSINGGSDTFIFPTGGGTGQTICTSGISCASGGGQAVILEPGTGSGTAQTSNANRPSIWINRTGGTGNLLQLQYQGNDAFVLDSTGAANIPLASGLALGKAGVTNGKLTFGRGGASGGTIALQAANGTSSYTLTLPTSGPSGNQCLATDSGGQLSFTTCLTGSGGNGVTNINDGTNNASGAVLFKSTDGSVNFTVTGSSVDFSVPAGATGVTSIGTIDSQTKSTDGAVISGSTLVLQTADASSVGLVSTGAQTFAGAKTFNGNVAIQGSGGLTLGNGATQGKLSLVSASSGANVTIQSDAQAAARLLTIPTITADDEICLKTKANCASTGSNFIQNGTSQQTSANFNIQSTAGAVAAKIQGASGQDIIEFFGSGSSSTPVAKIDGSGNLTAVGGTFTGNIGAVAATFTGALNGTSGTFSGALSAAGVNSNSGLIQGSGGLTVGGTITLSSLGAGVLHSSSGGVISSSAVQLGTDTSGSYVANLGTLTGLTTSGNSGAGSTPTLSVAYGSSANTAVQGNTALTCASGTGNLTGGGGTITLGSGGACGSLNLISSPTITGNMVVQGGSLSLGVNGTATGQLKLGNATASSQFVTLQADSRSVAATITIPTGSQTSDEVCLRTLANCTGNGSGGSNFIINGTSQQAGANFNIQSTSGAVAAKIQGAASQDIIEFFGSGSSSTVLAKIDSIGGLTAASGSFTGAVSAGSGSITGTLSVGGNTSVTNGSLTVGNGANQGVLTLVSAGSGSNLLFKSDNQTANRNLTVPTLGADDTLCLVTLGNCTGSNSGSGNTSYIFNQTSQQTSANFNIDGSGTIGTNLTVNGTSALNGATTVKNNSTSGFQVQNASSNVLLNVDTQNNGLSVGNGGVAGTIQIGNTTGAVAQTINVGNNATASSSTTLNLGSTIGTSATNLQGGSGGVNVTSGTLTLGVAGTTTGSLVFGTSASNSRTVTLVASNPSVGVGNLTLTLPGASATQNTDEICLKNAVNCPGSATTLQGAYTASTGGTTPEIILDTTRGGIDIQNNNSTPISGASLFAVRDKTASGLGTAMFSVSDTGATNIQSTSSTALRVQNAAGTTTLLTADTSALRVSVGGIGTATGQLYVSGNTPSGALSSSSNSVASAYGLAIQGRYAYVTPTNATGLLVYDISNPAASPLPLVSSRSTTSSANKKVKVQGRYAYVAGGGTFAVYDISNPKSIPTAVGSASYTSGTNIPSLYVQGRYAYVGDSGTPTLYVFDISNPAVPVLAGSVAVASSGNGPADIYVQGRYAYIVNGGTNRFQIVDVSNPLSPSLASTITSTNITSVPTTLTVQGHYAYVGTSVGPIYVIDTSDPSTPAISTSVSLSGGSTHSLAAQGRYLYAGDATNGLIRTIDISTPTSAALLSGTTTANSPLALVADGRYVYTANNAAGVILQSFDFGGAYTQQLEAGGITTETLSVRGNTNFASDVAIQGSLGVGTGLQVAGNSGFSGAVGIQTNSGGAFQVKNSSGSAIVNVDTTNNIFAANGSTYSGGTISQSGVAVTGSGTAFSQAMVGGTIFYNDGTSGTVVAVTNNTTLTSSLSKTVAAGSSYSIYYGGIRTSSTGATQIQTTTNSTAGFQVQNAFGTNLLTVDTTSNSLIYNGTFDSTVNGWSTSTGSGSVTWNINGFSGGAALMVFYNGTSGDFINTTLSSPTVSGQSYTLSFYAKKSAGGGTDNITANFGGGSVSCASVTSTTYTQYTCSRTATSASSAFSLSGATTTNGSLIDNITLLPTGTTLSIGSIIANTTIIGVSATTSNTAGTALTLAGGAGTGNAAGGDINLQIAKAGSSGSVSNPQATVMNISGSTGAATFKNATDSTTAFQIQNASSGVALNVDTTTLETTVGGGANAASFGSRTDIAAGSHPYSVVYGDFNIDGKTDAVVVNQSSNTALLFLGTGSGLATSPTTSMATGNSPRFVATGDFNGDGKTDLIVTNSGSVGANGASVYLNTGSGLPSIASYNLTTGTNPYGVAVGDFNNDGKADAAIANFAGANVSVYINTGTALPTSATNTVTVGNQPIGISVGDISGDGKADAVVSNWGTGGTGTTASVLVSNGSTLAASATITTGNGPTFAALADFNGDGKIDAAVANAGNGNGTTASVFINTGTALPSSANYTLTLATGPESIQAADFNGDGRMDVVTVSDADNVSVYINSISNVLPSTATISLNPGTGSGPVGVSAGDFNNDGRPDILTANYGLNNISLYLNTGVSAALTVKGSQRLTTNSATALQIQNASGTSLLQVNTANMTVTISGTAAGYNTSSPAALYVGMDIGTGRSINAAGTINASGADYAEWIPWSGPKPEPGTLVEYMGSTMVVSSPKTAGFVGNDGITDQENAILVTFTGQVPVRITGEVAAGDYLVPNGDGTARGVSPAAASLSDYFSKVATALEAGDGGSVKGLVSGPGASSQFNPQAVSNFTDINVTGMLNTDKLVVADTAQFKGNIIVEGHIVTSGGQPTSTIQASAGSGATVSVDGTDITGTITITTGSAPQAGDLAKLIFSKVYAKTPRIVLSPSNDNAADLRSFKGTTTLNDFMLRTKDVPTANTVYTYDYFIAQ